MLKLVNNIFLLFKLLPVLKLICAILQIGQLSRQLEGMATSPLRQLQGDQFAQKVFNCGTKGHIPLEKRSSSLSFADTEDYIDQNFNQKSKNISSKGNPQIGTILIQPAKKRLTHLPLYDIK